MAPPSHNRRRQRCPRLLVDDSLMLSDGTSASAAQPPVVPSPSSSGQDLDLAAAVAMGTRPFEACDDRVPFHDKRRQHACPDYLVLSICLQAYENVDTVHLASMFLQADHDEEPMAHSLTRIPTGIDMPAADQHSARSVQSCMKLLTVRILQLNTLLHSAIFRLSSGSMSVPLSRLWLLFQPVPLRRPL